WRWGRRHPGWAAMFAVVAALLAVILVGGTVLNLWLSQALLQAQNDRLEARASERARREQLLDALIAEARSQRWSRRPGQRVGTLATLKRAAALARDLGRSQTTLDELRDLAASALALADIRSICDWPEPPEGYSMQDVERRDLNLYAISNH